MSTIDYAYELVVSNQQIPVLLGYMNQLEFESSPDSRQQIAEKIKALLSSEPSGQDYNALIQCLYASIPLISDSSKKKELIEYLLSSFPALEFGLAVPYINSLRALGCDEALILQHIEAYQAKYGSDKLLVLAEIVSLLKLGYEENAERVNALLGSLDNMNAV